MPSLSVGSRLTITPISKVEKILEPCRKIALRSGRSLSAFSNYLLIEEKSQSHRKLRRILSKLKALASYTSFSLFSHELYLTQRSLQSLDLVSSKFSCNNFRKTLTYLLTHKSSFPALQQAFVASRLSRDRENILDTLPNILQNLKLDKIGLGLLYARDLPSYDGLSVDARNKVKSLVIMVDDGYSISATLPSILAFQNLEYLSISNPFRGFSINEADCENWKALGDIHNLRSFSIELSGDNRNALKFGLLLGSLKLPKRLNSLSVLLHFVPLEGLVDLYHKELAEFMQRLSTLRDLSALNLRFDSETSRKLKDITGLLCNALKDHNKLKEVSIVFSEPRNRTSYLRNHSNLDITSLLCSLRNSANKLEKLQIAGIKGEFKEMREVISFPNVRKMMISIEEEVTGTQNLSKFLECFKGNGLKRLELDFKCPLTSEDLEALKSFKGMENMKICVLGTSIDKQIGVLREIFLSSLTLKEIYIEFPELDFREEARVHEMMALLMNKKRLGRITLVTRYLRYSFDRNIDVRMREQSSEHRKRMRLI